MADSLYGPEVEERQLPSFRCMEYNYNYKKAGKAVKKPPYRPFSVTNPS